MYVLLNYDLPLSFFLTLQSKSKQYKNPLFVNKKIYSEFLPI